MLVATLVFAGVVAGPETFGRMTMTVLIAFFAIFIGFKAVLHLAAINYKVPSFVLPDAEDPDLPMYTVLVPLYKEGDILPHLVESMSMLLYNKQRLQVLLLIEEDDEQTQEALARLRATHGLPKYFETIIVPEPGPGEPRTKPRACNYAMQYVKGEYCVIYDAEDRPEPEQLLKAVAAFRYYGHFDKLVQCLQARLTFVNPDSSWVSRMYAAEYYVHFNWVLPGMAKLGIVPPLGGTSNHFRTEVLRQLAFEGTNGDKVWDPHNVTEDADLGMVLARKGFKVVMLDSYTYEEATTRLRAAVNQRSRWIKGYMQTGIVGLRHPRASIQKMGVVNYIAFNLLMLGTPITQFLNPVFWVLTAWWFVAQPHFISQLFVGPTFYVGALLLFFGNPLMWAQQIFAVPNLESKRGEGGVKYMVMLPIWWAATSWSTVKAVYELLHPGKRSFWHKTEHGHTVAAPARTIQQVSAPFVPLEASDSSERAIVQPPQAAAQQGVAETA